MSLPQGLGNSLFTQALCSARMCVFPPCSIGTMELFYTQVSEGMRSLGTSFYLLSVAVGTYLASALNIIVASASPVDLWVADNPLFGHYDWWVSGCWCSSLMRRWLLTDGKARPTMVSTG